MAQVDFEYLWSTLLSEVPQLPPPVAQRYISDAWLGLQDEREWSFRHKDGILVLPAVVTTGTISVTQYSLSATLSAAASAAWLALAGSLPAVQYRQLRFPSRSDRIYNISSWDSALAVTLDKMYTGTTDTVSTYKLYSAYALPYKMTGVPEPYFLRFLSLRSIDYGWTMLDSNNRIERRQLDAHDPGRINYGLPLCYCYSHDSQITINDIVSQYRFYEFWPHSTAALSYEMRYIKRGVSFEEDPTQYLPEVIPPRLVILRALIDAYRWAESHGNSHPELSRRNWQYLRAQLASKYPTDRDTYEEHYRKAVMKDNDLMNQEIISRTSLYNQSLLAVPMTLVVTA